ncbi:alpha-lytic protease prodomain-containing protein [Streptomyces sp. NPDC059970]|uniref:alpha-lytic protease prodomain-containing protein n=1 Tax=Streptomyces sp. NPDC059970 TaxID=3347019 RepID=UPI00369EAC1C
MPWPRVPPPWPYVDVAPNRVVVQAARASAAGAFLAAADVSREMVTVIRSGEMPRTFADLRGGDAYCIATTTGSAGRPSLAGRTRWGRCPGAGAGLRSSLDVYGSR